MKTSILSTCLFSALSSAAMAAFVIDGQGIPSAGLPLVATQDTPTQFGNSTGTQSSLGGSELNQLYGTISGTTLQLGITGNLEGNFNKMWIFFDAVAGGENTLLNDNADGGFGEINNMAGLQFGGGFTADHGLRFEIGDGFYGVRYFDLIDNVGGDILTGGGPGDLPLNNAAGAFGTTIGWDNSNSLGVDGSSAAGASTATTGWEIAIDMNQFFGELPSSVGVTAFITNGDATFGSNQVLPGLGGGDNLGDLDGQQVGMVVVPEPSTGLMTLLAGLGFLTRRRR